MRRRGRPERVQRTVNLPIKPRKPLDCAIHSRRILFFQVAESMEQQPVGVEEGETFRLRNDKNLSIVIHKRCETW